MIEKELKLLTADDVKIGHVLAEENSNGKRVYTSPFEGVLPDGINMYMELNTVDASYHYAPELLVTLNVAGDIIEHDAVDLLSIKGSTLAEVEKDYPGVAKYFRDKLNPAWIKVVNGYRIDRRKAYTTTITAQYAQLLQVHKDLGYKADVAKIEEINDLLYCEASEMFDKIEDRISKKSTTKSIKLYKALKTLRDEIVITCADQ